MFIIITLNAGLINFVIVVTKCKEIIHLIIRDGICVNSLEKWRHFVSPKTLLCFRIRVSDL